MKVLTNLKSAITITLILLITNSVRKTKSSIYTLFLIFLNLSICNSQLANKNDKIGSPDYGKSHIDSAEGYSKNRIPRQQTYSSDGEEKQYGSPIYYTTTTKNDSIGFSIIYGLQKQTYKYICIHFVNKYFMVSREMVDRDKGWIDIEITYKDKTTNFLKAYTRLWEGCTTKFIAFVATGNNLINLKTKEIKAVKLICKDSNEIFEIKRFSFSNYFILAFKS